MDLARSTGGGVTRYSGNGVTVAINLDRLRNETPQKHPLRGLPVKCRGGSDFFSLSHEPTHVRILTPSEEAGGRFNRYVFYAANRPGLEWLIPHDPSEPACFGASAGQRLPADISTGLTVANVTGASQRLPSDFRLDDLRKRAVGPEKAAMEPENVLRMAFSKDREIKADWYRLTRALANRMRVEEAVKELELSDAKVSPEDWAAAPPVRLEDSFLRSGANYREKNFRVNFLPGSAMGIIDLRCLLPQVQDKHILALFGRLTLGPESDDVRPDDAGSIKLIFESAVSYKDSSGQSRIHHGVSVGDGQVALINPRHLGGGQGEVNVALRIVSRTGPGQDLERYKNKIFDL